MKVTSKDLYAILRESLAPAMKRAGFERLKMGMLGWFRPESTRYVSVWFQCDKYGWFTDFGSRFTLEFQLASDPAAGSGNFKSRSRFAALLTRDELELVRALNNRIVQSLPPPQPTNPVFALSEEGQKSLLSFYQVRGEPYHQGEDVWLHYFTREDVDAWASFFKDRLTQMTSEFLGRLQARR